MDKYSILKNIGSGTYGTVFKAKNSETGEIVAIKRMERKYKNWDECMSLREVKSLRKMNHPNLVKLKEVFKKNEDLLLVFEYVDLNLYQMYMTYKEKKSQMPESIIKKIIYQIALGLDSLHNTGYFHRDLKPENILVNMNSLNVKVCDFGLAREVRCRPPLTEYVSTRWYRAPEILLHSQTYNSPIDIFGLGCIMAELYNLAPLFSGANEVDQFYKVVTVLGTPQGWNEGVKLAQKLQLSIPKKEPIPLNQVVPRASMEALQLLSDMLQYDPLKRPTAIQITKYPFFDDINKEQFNDSINNVYSNQSLSSAHLPPPPPALQQQSQAAGVNTLTQSKSIQNFSNLPNSNPYNNTLTQPGQYYDKKQRFNNIESVQPQLVNDENRRQVELQMQQQQQHQRKQNIQQHSMSNINMNKPSNPFQQYKDEYLKSQNIYAKQHNQNSNYTKRATNQLLFEQNQQQAQSSQPFNAASSTNYNFAAGKSNQIGMSNQQPLGGTLERPLNFNYQFDVQKVARKQNNLLKKNYEQGYENYNSQPTNSNDIPNKYNDAYKSYDSNNKAAAFFNQFNRAQNPNINNNNNNINNNYYAKNSSVPPEYRNNPQSDIEGSNLNKLLEDKLNWAF